MIKMITAFTTEADIAEVAIKDIHRKIDASRLKAHTAAIIECHAEFVDTGVMEAVCKSLPFETVGITCSLPAVTGTSSQLALTVTVLTSDECEFKVLSFEADEASKVAENCYETALKFAEGGRTPALVLSYVSFMSFVSGDVLVNSFSKGLPGVPVFGSLPITDEADYSRSFTIHNGKHTEIGAVYVGIYGNIKPTFKCSSLRTGTVYRTSGLIEKAEQTYIYTIDGMNALDYVVAKGIATHETYENVILQPLVLTYSDGSVIMRNCLNIDTEKRAIVLSGDAHPGAVVDFALIKAEDIRASAAEIANEIAYITKEASVVLLYSCATRLWQLGTATTDEINIISEKLGKKAYSFAYSGGEIYPVSVDGKYINTFQNNNLCVCII
ncbi:MAG: FIST C-terminal domain-containing protein [Ruminococcus sp.]|jgi:hypothetical protein|nr:FIST C-terminal domain-containing protein [Ruminococcus sp.]